MNTTQIGVLEWENEHSVNSYPLTSLVFPTDFIIDAGFIQFDGFVPVIKQLKITQASMTFTLQVDDGPITAVVNKPSAATFAPGLTVRLDRAGRYLGFMTFGFGLLTLFAKYITTTISPNVSFVPSVVRGVSSGGGVFSLGGYAGAVQIYTGATQAEQTLFFDQSGQTVRWNAGALPTQSSKVPLRTLNQLQTVGAPLGAHPINNQVTIIDTELIKVTPQYDSVQLSLPIGVTTTTISPAIKYGP